MRSGWGGSGRSLGVILPFEWFFWNFGYKFGYEGFSGLNGDVRFKPIGLGGGAEKRKN